MDCQQNIESRNFFRDGTQGPFGAWQVLKEVKMLDFKREMNQKTSFQHLKYHEIFKNATT
jgi:hypothetical protein